MTTPSLRLSLVLLLTTVLLHGTASAGNPLVPGKGLTDAHGVVYDGRVYLYATHDFSPANKGFKMTDWWVWSSANLVDWTQEGTLKPEDTYLHKPFNDCWATFGVRKNGKYYWYFSAGRNSIGVVVADTPRGPWKDPLGKALVAPGLTQTQQRDPDILMDDDGKSYLVYGTFDYFIVRLGDDMISLAETPRPVVLDRRVGPYGEGKTDDKPSLHKRNGVYYLSWSSFYAVSSSPYGPFTYKGSVIDPALVAPDFRRQKLFHDRHGNFFEFNHQWYYACNDKSLPDRTDFFRDCDLSYVHFRDNGDMAPVRIDAVGVGEYDAAQPRIEAEDYFNAVNAEQRETPAGGFEVRNLKDGSALFYPRVKNLAANPTMSLQAACGTPEGATVEIHENDPSGKLLGSAKVPSTGGWDQYHQVPVPLHLDGGTHNLCLVVRGGTGEQLRLDWFNFTTETK